VARHTIVVRPQRGEDPAVENDRRRDDVDRDAGP
jgi:hypothetical protein